MTASTKNATTTTTPDTAAAPDSSTAKIIPMRMSPQALTYLESPEHKALLARREEFERQLRLQQLERSRIAKGIPSIFWPTLDNPQSTPSLEAVRKFAADESRSILLMVGDVGAGKSFASASWLDGQHSGMFVEAIDLVRAGTFDDAFWKEVKSATNLVLDDLGTEPLDPSGWALANLVSLLSHRYNWQRKTIITSNLAKGEFKSRYMADGGRLADRLRESGTFFTAAGKSLRTRKP